MGYQGISQVSVEGGKYDDVIKCGHLCFFKDKNGGINLLVGVLMSSFIILTSHEACEFYCRSTLPLSVITIYWIM